MLVGEGNQGVVAVLAAEAEELEEVLEEGDELVLALAVGQEQTEKYAEVAGPHEKLLRDLLGDARGVVGVAGEVGEGANPLERHL